MGKSTICIGKNKGADQLRGNREADQRLCFRYSDSTVPLLLKSEISRFKLVSVTVQVAVRKPHCWFSHEVAQLYRHFRFPVTVLLCRMFHLFCYIIFLTRSMFFEHI